MVGSSVVGVESEDTPPAIALKSTNVSCATVMDTLSTTATACISTAEGGKSAEYLMIMHGSPTNHVVQTYVLFNVERDVDKGVMS